MRSIIKPFMFLATLILSLQTSLVQAREAPNVFLERITQQVTNTLRQENVKNNPQKLYGVIDRILVPHIDWNAMARWTIGRGAWMKATKSQQMRFTQEFRQLLIHTYGNTLRSYNNQRIEYLPMRGAEGKNQVQVNSIIHESGKSAIRVSYRLVAVGGTWKVYDIVIEGVSLLKGFRSQFSADLQSKGMDQLIQHLQQHNKGRR